MSRASKKTAKEKSSQSVDQQINDVIAEYQAARTDGTCYPLLIRQSMIGPRTVEDVYEGLLDKKYECPSGRLIVIIDSSGGDIDAAYNLSNLFRDIGHENLEFVVPRWAKVLRLYYVVLETRFH